MTEEKNIINCRVCLRYDLEALSKCLSLFETYNGCSLSEKVNAIANVNIREGDGLPNMICPDCLLQLENAISFKEKCEASNKILCNVLLSQQPTAQEPEESKETDELKQEEIEVEVSPDPIEEYLEYSDTEDRLEKITADRPGELIEDHEGEEEVLRQPLKKSKAIDLQLICDDCNGRFKSKCKLRVHWKKIHEPEKLICPKCKRMFKSYKAFNLHMKSNRKSCVAATKVRIEGQGRLRVFHCKECSYKSKRIKDIDTHLTTHTGDRRFQCKDCFKFFTQHASLQGHREMAHKDYKIDTTCHLCGKHLLGRTRYYKHMRIHKQQEVQCKVCNKRLKSKHYLAAHMLRHSGVKSYSCEVCGASFYTYCEVYNHRTKVHNKSRSLKCNFCDYKLCTTAALKKHMSKHTDTNKICLVCGQFSENAEQLAIHQKRHFDRKVQCPQCEKMYHNKRSLYKHMGKHHRCTMLVNKRETPQIEIKKEIPPPPKDEIVILLSPPAIILK